MKGDCSTMSDTEREVVPTAHGEVEYEVVECYSCGARVAKEDAERFAIGGFDGETFNSYKFDSDRSTLGWACGYCVEDPISFPRVPVLRGWWYGMPKSKRDKYVVTILTIGFPLTIFSLAFLLSVIGSLL